MNVLDLYARRFSVPMSFIIYCKTSISTFGGVHRPTMITENMSSTSTSYKLPKITCSLLPKVSVIIPVKNERDTIVDVILHAYPVHPATEVIVVCNGTTDGTDYLAEEIGAIVIRENKALGHDVGRSVGASVAKGDILLFMDGDIVIPYWDLVPFVKAIEEGEADIALNEYQGPIEKKKIHSVVLAKYALNVALSRPDLKGCSLTTIPHAIHRSALDHIGIENLVVPPLAYAIAIKEGLRVKPVHYVDVSQSNIRRSMEHKAAVKKLIVGDHLEAIRWLTQMTNRRGAMTDLMRAREKVEEL